MHLLNTSTRKTQEFQPGKIPPYVIFSHRWEDEEISYKDLTQAKEDLFKLKGWTKLDSFCLSVEKDGWEWVWIDTCCIDTSSSAELSEAINSMYQWYMEAEFCIAYLADISAVKDETGMKRKQFDKSEWFERGWTLQELLASREVVFYDKSWINIGTRTTLKAHISRATRISSRHLSDPLQASVAAKMSWASLRKTTRPEDIAYCLLGLFNVSIPMLYGEGGYKAFQRLQYEIVRSRRDESIFAWTTNEDILEYATMPAPGLLAPSPKYFSESGDIVPIHPIHFERVNLHAPQILFDGLVWTLERSFREDKDRKERKILAPDEIPYVAPLACSKGFGRYPVKLRLVISRYNQPRRGPSTSLDSFSESEMQSIRHSEARIYRLIQEQPRAHSLFPKFRDFRRGFTLRLSASAQSQCSPPSKNGPGVELRTSREPGEYIVSVSDENRGAVGIVMRHEKGAVIDIAYQSTFLNKWRLGMKVNTQTLWIGLDVNNNSSGHNSINLGDCAPLFLEQGQNISVSPKHGLRRGQNEILIYMDCNAESTIDRRGIFSDDLVEGTIGDADDFDMSSSPRSSQR